MNFMSLEQKVIQTLRDTKKTLAVAESCTGGLLCHRLTNIPGSSEVLKFGVVAYSNEAKSNFLKVSSAVLRRFGAVSQETATAMAKGARSRLKSDIAISITGIAGPGGGSKTKPVGTTYMGISRKMGTTSFQFHFKGNRARVKQQSVDQALRLLLQFAA